MQKIIFLFIITISNSAFGIEDHKIMLKCLARLEKAHSFSSSVIEAEQIISFDIEKNNKNEPVFISKNGKINFGNGHNVIYNIFVNLGTNRSLFNNKEIASTIRARLQRDTVGNGKVVLGASANTIIQKSQKKDINIAIDIINVKALNSLVNEVEYSGLENDPILFKNNFSEAIYIGTLDEGVVKSAHIECSTL